MNNSIPESGPETTVIYRKRGEEEELLGYIDGNGVIYKVRWGEGRAVGRVAAGRLWRKTAHDERELGLYMPDGVVRSHGLFEGGDLGWIDPDGVVVQAGLILGEEEVGRIQGPAQVAGAAALLLLFLPDEMEANKNVMRGT